MTARPERIAERFADGATIAGIERLRGGHIHDSWVVTLRRSGVQHRLLLQRINDGVFADPGRLMQNVERVTKHVGGALSLVHTREGSSHAIDKAGGWWRAYRYIEGTVSFEAPDTPEMAYRAARAFGEFQRKLTDLQGPALNEVIRGFHDTPARYAAFERALREDRANRAADARAAVHDILARRPLTDALLAPFERGEIRERVVHNDAKMSNVLIDASTHEPVCVVDLDTVMPGLALYDFGDMARSMASPAAEDERDLSRVAVRPEYYAALATGYVEGAGPLVSSLERRLLVVAAKVITFEQAIRFLTDYLEGDQYYSVTNRRQNLDRAAAQLALLRSFELQERALSNAI